MTSRLLIAATYSITFLTIGAQEADLAFAKNFIFNYDLNKRDTHEYTTYTLEKTAKSFNQLEQALIDKGIVVKGHYCIFGFQEEAITPYRTQWQREALKDEVIVKTQAGLSAPTKNIFGFMTAFLLKDAQWLQTQWQKDHDPQVRFICARALDILNDHAVFFQKHSFGSDYDFLLAMRDEVEKSVYRRDTKAMLDILVQFWTGLEQRASKTGSQEAIATQDMLFSISYAQALLKSSTPLTKFFVGPDITYPIEVLSVQHSDATINAQEFIEVFQKELAPLDDEPTAYVFCSFVDGVGKSTLLNNIRNWKEHAHHFDKYQRCDNSSSQESAIFELREKVFIVDLPAQLSHFVIKPDGHVFVDAATVKDLQQSDLTRVQEYIAASSQSLIDDCYRRIAANKQADKPLYATGDPLEQYAHNCAIFDAPTPDWIACCFENRHYLFHKKNPEQLRVLVPLANAHSMGLKVIEPESMLFSNGLSLPMTYTVFMQDLIQKLKESQVTRVVFVNFLSMYPRTSRETIRVNFILQYLKKLFHENYSLEKSFYAHRVHKGQETCKLLTTQLDTTAALLSLETALRWGLNELMQATHFDKVTTLSGDELETTITHMVKKLLQSHGDELKRFSYDYLEPQQQTYRATYELDRIYQTIIQYNPQALVAFSHVIEQLFTKGVVTPYFAYLWKGMDGQPLVLDESAKLPAACTLDNGVPVECLYKIHLQCKEERDLKEFFRSVRAQYYALLSNLLQASVDDEGRWTIAKIVQVAPPLVIKMAPDKAQREAISGNSSDNKHLYALQKYLPAVDISEHPKVKPPSQFHVIDTESKTLRWGIFNRALICLDWENVGTSFGIYAYGYEHLAEKKATVTKMVNFYRQKLNEQGSKQKCVPVSLLYQQASQEAMAAKIKAELGGQKPEVIEPSDPRIAGIRLWARAIATLDMIIKDTESRIIIRKGSRDDFIAAIKLLEMITLPEYFNISLKEPLFADYAHVEPLVPWQILLA